MGFSHDSPAEPQGTPGAYVLRGVCNGPSMDSLGAQGHCSFQSSESQRGSAPLTAGDYFIHKGTSLILPVFLLLVLPENSLDLNVRRGRIQQKEFSRDNYNVLISCLL